MVSAGDELPFAERLVGEPLLLPAAMQAALGEERPCSFERHRQVVVQSERPVLLFGADRCYDLGRERAQLLLYCPDGSPRIQRVADQDPRLRDTGTAEVVFSTR